MKSTDDSKIKPSKLICPICEDIMKECDYIYDTLKDEKVNYKCDNCGHKTTKIL